MEFGEKESSGVSIVEIKRSDFPPSASETWLPASIVLRLSIVGLRAPNYQF